MIIQELVEAAASQELTLQMRDETLGGKRKGTEGDDSQRGGGSKKGRHNHSGQSSQRTQEAQLSIEVPKAKAVPQITYSAAVAVSQ